MDECLSLNYSYEYFENVKHYINVKKCLDVIIDLSYF